MTKQIKKGYEITGELGSGGMAIVFKGVQKSLDRPVAIKELKEVYRSDSVIVQRFEREARLAASFQHENIVHVYDYGHKPDYCIIMEYVDGITLTRIIEESGPLPTDVGIMIALQAASALEYAHARGIIHRDIKPGNIMVKKNGEVKLMDFGIARTKDLDSLTMPGTLLGTPSYMSPEQIQGEPLDIRSDIFSFGVVLYEMFTGMKPFPGDQPASVTAHIVKGAFPPPRNINPDLPRSIQRVIKKCLRKKLHRRYDSMQDIARALGKRIRGMDKAASLKRISDYLVEAKLVEAPPSDETVVIYRAPGMGNFTRTLVMAAVALLAVSGAIAYYSWTKARTIKAPPPAPAVISAPVATVPVISAPVVSAPVVSSPVSTLTTSPTQTSAPALPSLPASR